MIKPHLTEKSMTEAKRKSYTFLVGRDMDKRDIKNTIEQIYDVHVTKVRTIKMKVLFKKNSKGKIVKVPAIKKAMIALKTDEKIDVFEEKK